MLTLYHGTSSSRGIKILEDKKIDCNAELRFKRDRKEIVGKSIATTQGYIYCTDSILMAIYYGVNHSSELNERQFYIFKFELDENLLEPDEDEITIFDDTPKCITVAESLLAYRSVRCNESIFRFEYCILPFNIDNSKEGKIIRRCVNNHSYNPKTADGGKTEIVEKLMKELNDIIKWQQI